MILDYPGGPSVITRVLTSEKGGRAVRVRDSMWEGCGCLLLPGFEDIRGHVPRKQAASRSEKRQENRFFPIVSRKKKVGNLALP